MAGSRPDGKVWEGMPDTSIYANMDGIECISYSEYHYDEAGHKIGDT